MDNETPSALPPMFTKPAWKKWMWPVVAGVTTLALVAVGASYIASKNTVAVPTTTTTDTTQTQTDTQASNDTPVYKTSEYWLDIPVKLGDLKLFDIPTAPTEANPSDFDSNVGYYKVGTDSTNDLIIAVLTPNSPDHPYNGLISKSAAGVYTLLKQHSSGLYDTFVPTDGTTNNDLGKYVGPKLATGMTIDKTTAYKSLKYQKTITVNGATLTNSTEDYDFFVTEFSDPGSQPVEYATVSSGKLFAQTWGKGDGFKIQEYVLRLPDWTDLVYQLRPSFIADDFIPNITWNDGKTNKDTYRIDGIGSCGSASGLAVMDSSDLSGLTAAGTASGGSTVYEFTDPNNATLQYFYKLYSTVENALTISQYRAKHAVFVWKDALGRLIIFNSTVYGPQAECGKPVVYLYPTVPTAVSVKVDAKITKSDPAYGLGWNVLAMPNSSLYLGAKKYNSLFWEGTGKTYPTVNGGSVIAQANLSTTLDTQLHQLGLNDKESRDFLAFWIPKMPPSPYVRVSWFGKSQMDLLAPLTVTPKPDTVIRIFMDFAGLDAPITIAPQRLSAPARRGFTVVEWGGLLRTTAAIQ